MGKGKSMYSDMVGAIVHENDIKNITHIYKMLLASNAVCKIVSSSKTELGTGFLISPNLILTNNHVIPSGTPNDLKVFFESNFSISNGDIKPTTPVIRNVSFDVFLTDLELDFTIVAIDQPIDFEFMALGRNNLGKECIVVHYPGVDSKGITLDSIKIVGDIPKQISDFCKHNFWYESDTSPGSSGSPLFDSDWKLIGLHHGILPKYEYADADREYKFIKKDDTKVSVKDYYTKVHVRNEEEYVPIVNEGTKIIDIIDKIVDKIDQTNTKNLKELKAIIEGKPLENYDTLKDTSIAINKIKKSLII